MNTTFDINLYETTFRGYDPQIGRFHQIDPLSGKFPEWSPYSFAFNNPIGLNDPMGAEPVKPKEWIQKQINSENYGKLGRDGESKSNIGVILGKLVEDMNAKELWGTEGVPTYEAFQKVVGDFYDGKLLEEFIKTGYKKDGGSLVGSTDPSYNNISTGVGAFSIGWSTKEIMIQGAVADARRIRIAQVNRISNIRTFGATGAGYIKVVKGVSTGANILGAGMTIADGYVNGFKAHHAADLGIQAVIYGIGASIPIAGWIVGGAYYLGDMYFQSTHNGVSITQYYLNSR